MRFALFLLIGLVLVAGAALAEPPDDHGVTVLRGSSAPPPPPAPAPNPEPPIVQREIVYAPYPAPYPAYFSPGFGLPAFVVTTPHRHFHPVVPSTTVPDGWPLFKTPTRR
jgi:hypothetical protein